MKSRGFRHPMHSSFGASNAVYKVWCFIQNGYFIAEARKRAHLEVSAEFGLTEISERMIRKKMLCLWPSIAAFQAKITNAT